MAALAKSGTPQLLNLVQSQLGKRIESDDADIPFRAAKHVALVEASNVELRDEDT